MQRQDRIHVDVNVTLTAYERGKRKVIHEGHNVFTDVGRAWLAELVGWASIGGGGDVPYTNRRPRWMAVGSGAQAELASVTGLVTPLPITAGRFLGAITQTELLSPSSVRYSRNFDTSEVSFGGEVLISEVGLYPDVFPASTEGGSNDSASGLENTTLDPTSGAHPPIAYHTFTGVPKTGDINYLVEWTFDF